MGTRATLPAKRTPHTERILVTSGQNTLPTTSRLMSIQWHVTMSTHAHGTYLETWEASTLCQHLEVPVSFLCRRTAYAGF